jgi:hypothetical protein
MLFRYPQVEEALAQRHCYDAGTRIALLGQIRHYQRLQFPPGVATAVGLSALYTPGQLLLLACAFEMAQLGFSHERAADIILQNQEVIKEAVSSALGADAMSAPDRVMLLFNPDTLNALQGMSHHESPAQIVRANSLAHAFEIMGRAIVLDVSRLIAVALSPAISDARISATARGSLADWALLSS